MIQVINTYHGRVILYRHKICGDPLSLHHDERGPMKRLFVAAVLTAVTAAGLGLSPAQANNWGETQGCTPGYWKNHTDNWQSLSPTDTIHKMAGTTLPAPYDTTTALSALQGGGGPGLAGARTIFLRALTAAWLNAAWDDPNGGSALAYPFRRFSDVTSPTTGEVYVALKTQLNNAMQSTSRDYILGLATRLDTANNLGCPLN